MEVQKKAKKKRKANAVRNRAHNSAESRPLLSKPSEPLCKQPETSSQFSVNSKVTHQQKDSSLLWKALVDV